MGTRCGPAGTWKLLLFNSRIPVSCAVHATICLTAGEDALRASGVEYTIVRPGGLGKGPGGQSTIVTGEGLHSAGPCQHRLLHVASRHGTGAAGAGPKPIAIDSSSALWMALATLTMLHQPSRSPRRHGGHCQHQPRRRGCGVCGGAWQPRRAQRDGGGGGAAGGARGRVRCTPECAVGGPQAGRCAGTCRDSVRRGPWAGVLGWGMTSGC